MQNKEKIERCKLSLTGLSIGDALGDSFFAYIRTMEDQVSQKSLPRAPWYFTDDTIMSFSVVKILEQKGEICQDELVQMFAKNYLRDPRRGYGATAGRILKEIARGVPWQKISQEVFSGMGSMGNGAAMRAAPTLAFFFISYAETLSI